jgi:hypothetical protein
MNQFRIVSVSEVVPGEKNWRDYVKGEVESRVQTSIAS